MLGAAGPEIDLASRDFARVDITFVEGAKAGDQAEIRRENREGIAMGLDDARIGVDLEESVEVAHVDGILEQPGSCRIPRPDQPQ